MRIRLALLSLLLPLGLFAADPPNLVIIYTDDQGYGDASCLNPESKFQTPSLDRIAREGMIFTDGHCSDTVCTPSRYGILTGRYSWRTTLKGGVFGAEAPCLIKDGRVTIASLLKESGYDTAMVGKWHLGMDFPGEWNDRDWTQPTVDMPLDKGFDYFWGIPASMNYGVLAWFDQRTAAVPPTLFTRKKDNAIAIKDYRIMPPYETEPQNNKDLEVAPDFVDVECLSRFTDQAVAWLEKREATKPFFLYLPFTSPHKPVVPAEEFQGKSEAGAYGDFMMETDSHVGRILDTLDKTGVADNTMVVLTSDNGPENTWPIRLEKYGHDSNLIYRDGKRSIYEGGHRVPFLVRWPAAVKAGSTWDQPVCQTDILATFAEILGKDLPADGGEDSVSFLPALMGAETVAARPPLIHHGVSGRFSIRDGKWKLVMETKKKGEKRELYDLSQDPSEEKSVLEENPEVEKRLLGQLTAIIKDGRSSPGEPVPNDTGWWNSLVWIKESDW